MNIAGPTANFTFVAPAGTMVFSRSVAAPPSNLFTVALAGAIQPNAPPARVVVAAPAGSTHLGPNGPTANLTIVSPAGIPSPSVLPAQVFITPLQGGVRFGPIGSPATVVVASYPGGFSFGPVGDTKGLILFGPYGSLATALAGVTAAVVIAAPAGAVTYGPVATATPNVIVAVPASTLTTSPVGQVSNVVTAAPAGGLVQGPANPTAQVTTAAPTGQPTVIVAALTVGVTINAPAGTVVIGTLTGFSTVSIAVVAPPGVAGPDTTPHIVLSGTSARHRYGVVNTQTVLYVAIAYRQRSAVAKSVITVPLSPPAAGRHRGRSAYLQISTASSTPSGSNGGLAGGGGSLSTGTAFVRWRFDDPTDGSFYVFEINPNEGGTKTRKRSLTARPTLASDGKQIIFEGVEELPQATIKGVLRNKGQYDAFVAWFNKRHPVLMTDDIGRQQRIYIEQFVPKRAISHRAVYRHTYELKVRILG